MYLTVPKISIVIYLRKKVYKDNYKDIKLCALRWVLARLSTELDAFIGILFAAGVLPNNMIEADQLWHINV